MPAPAPITVPREIRGYLVPQERVVLIQHRHWIALYEPILIVGAGLLVIGWLDAILPSTALALRDLAIIIWLGTVVWGLWRLLDWWRDYFIATDRRLINLFGIVTRNVAMMPLSKVTDMTYKRTVPGRFFGYGTFVVESAGQDQALQTVDFLPYPEQLYLEVCGLIFKDKGDSDD